MEEKARQIAALLKVLANENRLLMLCALMKSPLSVGEIAKYVPHITQSALSQHLTLMKTAGILDFHKTGQSVVYHIADHRAEDVLRAIQTHFCT